MQYSKNDLQVAAKNVVGFVRENLLDEQGILLLGKQANGVYVNEQIIDDFGDVAPFLALYGGEDICKKQLDNIIANADQLGFERVFAYTDLILGLIWYSRVGMYADEATELAIKLSNIVLDEWYRGGTLRSLKKNGVIVPLTKGIDTTFIEVWTEMSRLTGDDVWLDRATNLYQYYDNLQHTNKMQLVPANSIATRFAFLNQLKNLFSFKAIVLKDNANYAFGLLDLYRLNSDLEIKKSFDDLFECLDVMVRRSVLPNNIFSQTETELELLPSFIYIDLMCDAYQLFDDEKYLASARTLADVWLVLQSKTTGLFPMVRGLNYSYFDSETDMGVALMKLHECTGDNKYKDSLQKLLSGLLKYHANQGFPLSVNVESGEVVDGFVKTKFVALFIKLLHAQSQDSRIYSDEKLFMLTKDR